jgi:quinol-cytochrome oxidoreductase complex cytochrome b subunit
MTEIKRNIKTRILTFGLIILAGIPTFFINSFSHPAIIIILTGILFGLALTIPNFDKSRKQIIAIVTLPIVMVMLYVVSIGLGLVFGFINNSYTNKTGIIIVGIISAFCFVFVIDQYYSIKKIEKYLIQ